MEKKLFISSILVWLLLVAAATINGFFREFYLKAIFNDTISYFFSAWLLIIIIFIFTYLFLRRYKNQYLKKHLIFIGIIWFSFTVFFEFVFGRFAAGYSWEELLTDYNLLNGRIWILVLLSCLTFPYLVGKRFLNQI